MREATLALHRVIRADSPAVNELLARMGRPAASCLLHVLGFGWPLKQWARQGWAGAPLLPEAASGVLVAALGILADGDARLLLDEHWRRLRRAALKRDGYRCTVRGCCARVTHVDHIVTRPRCAEPTPLDRLDNLRSLCASHDAQIKERADGSRGRGGRAVVKGCDVDGWPLAPG